MSDQSKARVGKWVKVKDEMIEEEEVYHLAERSDPKRNQITTESPLGKALVGARPGDKVAVQGPAGVMKFAVLEVGQE